MGQVIRISVSGESKASVRGGADGQEDESIVIGGPPFAAQRY
jgi:hypothetical protein